MTSTASAPMPATERKIAPTFVGSATFSRMTTRRAFASRDSGEGSAGTLHRGHRAAMQVVAGERGEQVGRAGEHGHVGADEGDRVIHRRQRSESTDRGRWPARIARSSTSSDSAR